MENNQKFNIFIILLSLLESRIMFIVHDDASAIYIGENKRSMIVNSWNPQKILKKK